VRSSCPRLSNWSGARKLFWGPQPTRSSSRAVVEGSRCATFKLSHRDPSTSLGMTVIFSMVKVSVNYTGNLHCDATHGPSQSKIATDAPADNKGKGEAFSPTDLVATALGTCISTTMGIKAEELGVDLRGMKVSVQKEMSKDAPRRIVALPSEVHIPLPPNSPHREVLEQTALNCPVHKSLPPEINRPTRFFWEG